MRTGSLFTKCDCDYPGGGEPWSRLPPRWFFGERYLRLRMLTGVMTSGGIMGDWAL